MGGAGRRVFIDRAPPAERDGKGRWRSLLCLPQGGRIIAPIHSGRVVGHSFSRSARFMAIRSVLHFVLVVAAGCLFAAAGHAAEMKVPVTFSGGHEIGRGDFGRPVALIAAGLGVKTDVFREAFSGVTPSRNGPPSGDESRKNKAALMKVLAPHGVSNDRLDEVSNYYRFRRQNGELWPTTPAKAYAIVAEGKIKKIVVTEPGSGYCSLPEVSVEGFPDAELKATLLLSKDLKKNGGISSVEMLAK
jgi:hypothetical protein